MKTIIPFLNRSPQKKKKFEFGIALSGGGARAISHIGALKAMNESGFQFDCYSGTSAGAIVAILSAMGWTTEHMLQFLSAENIITFSNLAIPKTGLLKLDGLGKRIVREIGKSCLEDLPKPVFIHVVDLVSGKVLAFQEGPIDILLNASCSIPGLFAPIHFQNAVLVDGGIMNNLPVETIRPLCSHVTAVNINPVLDAKKYSNLFTVLHRSFSLIIHANVKASMDMADISFDLEGVEEFSILDNSKAQKVHDIGYHCTRSFIQQLEQNQA